MPVKWQLLETEILCTQLSIMSWVMKAAYYKLSHQAGKTSLLQDGTKLGYSSLFHLQESPILSPLPDTLIMEVTLLPDPLAT